VIEVGSDCILLKEGIFGGYLSEDTVRMSVNECMNCK